MVIRYIEYATIAGFGLCIGLNIGDRNIGGILGWTSAVIYYFMFLKERKPWQ